ncbi:MAG: hypothetical protein D6714_19340 [Bacteroidetes bacterium]|nr:MAG: hypothetical protein D6714_19340 [Bacteroidota bacterium]
MDLPRPFLFRQFPHSVIFFPENARAPTKLVRTLRYPKQNLPAFAETNFSQNDEPVFFSIIIFQNGMMSGCAFSRNPPFFLLREITY